MYKKEDGFIMFLKKEFQTFSIIAQNELEPGLTFHRDKPYVFGPNWVKAMASAMTKLKNLPERTSISLRNIEEGRDTVSLHKNGGEMVISLTIEGSTVTIAILLDREEIDEFYDFLDCCIDFFYENGIL